MSTDMEPVPLPVGTAEELLAHMQSRLQHAQTDYDAMANVASEELMRDYRWARLYRRRQATLAKWKSWVTLVTRWIDGDSIRDNH